MRLNNAAASVQLMKGLKETEVLCSETLFRCISPSMDVIPVTVYRLAPNSIVSDADHLSISVCLYSTLRTSYSIVESSSTTGMTNARVFPEPVLLINST